MASFTRVTVIVGLLVAVLLQLPIVQRFGTLVKLGLVIGKTIQPISDFPAYKCRRIHDERLQACEDMWLSQPTRELFLACSDPLQRPKWHPSEGALNFSARSTRDAFVVMDLESLEFKELPLTGFAGALGDGIINLVGFGGVNKDDGSVELSVTNARPSMDQTTWEVLHDQAAAGANVTIEVFRRRPGRADLEFLYTLADPLITTPNRVAVVEGKGLYVTNDHGHQKPGLLSTLSPLLNTGDVVFCPTAGPHSSGCTIASAGHSYPNGLFHSLTDGQIYVPSSGQGGIKVFTSHANGSLELKHEIALPYAVDNLSEDQNGNIWAAIIPDALDFFKHMADPYNKSPASSVFKITRGGSGEYSVTKILEDRDGEVLPGSTTVIHDATTGRLFLSGVVSPFITVCEPTHKG